MIRRVAMILVLVAITGLLVFGGIHRTQSVLASEPRDAGTVEVQGAGAHGGGHGKGNGTGQGAGRE
jgi:hypothetical protein